MIRQLISLCLGRSWRWPAVRDEHLRKHPECAACGADVNLVVHHMEPVHIAPGRELDPTNLMTMCARCHLFVGHLGSFRSWNRNVETDAAIWRRKIRSRP